MMRIRFLFVCAITITFLTLFEVSNPSVFTTETVWWAFAISLIAYVHIVEKKPLASLGICKPSVSTVSTAAIGFALALCGVVIFGLITIFTGLDAGSTEERLDLTASAPLWWLAIVFLRAGVVEELIFRGFVISRSIEFGAPPWLAIVFATALFVIPHAFFWPGSSLILVSLTGIAMGVVFVWKQDLLACILAHIAVNIGGTIAAILN